MSAIFNFEFFLFKLLHHYIILHLDPNAQFNLTVGSIDMINTSIFHNNKIHKNWSPPSPYNSTSKIATSMSFALSDIAYFEYIGFPNAVGELDYFVIYGKNVGWLVG